MHNQTEPVPDLLSCTNPNLTGTSGMACWTASGAAVPFTGVQSNYHWSSTTLAGNTAYAWADALYDGVVLVGDKTYTEEVWPVRGGR